MATTTNYNWSTPDDTALVKDGAAAIRTLGSSIDTTTKALNPSTTLGDIEYRSATANTNTRLGIGTTGQVLTVSGGVPAWATPGGSTPSFVGCRVTNSGAQSIANSTRTTILFDTESFDTDAFHSTSTNTGRMTIPTGKAGKYLVSAGVTFATNATGAREIYLFKNGSFYSQVFAVATSAGSSGNAIPDIISLAVGDYIDIRVEQSSGGSLDVRGDNWGVGATYFGITYLGA